MGAHRWGDGRQFCKMSKSESSSVYQSPLTTINLVAIVILGVAHQVAMLRPKTCTNVHIFEYTGFEEDFKGILGQKRVGSGHHVVATGRCEKLILLAALGPFGNSG